MNVRRLDSSSASFDQDLKALLAWETGTHATVEDRVKDIVAAVKARGDEALVEFTKTYDRYAVSDVSELCLSKERLQEALTNISQDQRSALELAATRIRDYHQHQLQSSWSITEEDGTVLGQKVTPMHRVGLYVPGGKASYPSSVLMNAIPAHVAGVKELVMVSPCPDGHVNDMVLAAAAIAGVDQVVCIGGAQAVAALAYGTESIAKVDKIVGPGNIYVATAKRQVFGLVDIDMIAGPSEILVVCDGQTDPDWVAMDLFSQAEHDEDAQAILVSPDESFLDAVQDSVARLLPTLSRKDIAAKSLDSRGAFIKCTSLDEAVHISNVIAPEHLELSVENPELWLDKVEHAGAIFMGRHTSEALGDYCAGPNHVLPTSGTARFSSPLGVYDFQKRSSVIHCSPEGASKLGEIASVLARGESLEAHALSAEYRCEKFNK